MLYNEWQRFGGYLCSVMHAPLLAREEKYYSIDCRWPSKLEITYFLEGYDEMHINGQTLVNTADTIRISPPVDLCGDDDAYCLTKENGSYISFHFHSTRPFCTETKVIDAALYPDLRKLFIKAFNIWFTKKDNYYFKAICVFYQVLDIIYQIENSPQINSGKYKKIELAVNHIHNHYNHHEFTCSALPEMCGIKHSYFNRIFEECFRTTPSKYVTNLRMKLAADMLISKKHSVTEIADKTGYESPAYFCNVFKKHFGMSPTKYSKGKIL